jgi:hypothetical protein
MRQAVFAHLAFGQVLNRLSPGITWFGWQVPLALLIHAGLGRCSAPDVEECS